LYLPRDTERWIVDVNEMYGLGNFPEDLFALAIMGDKNNATFRRRTTWNHQPYEQAGISQEAHL